jgi:hypothetical protein
MNYKFPWGVEIGQLSDTNLCEVPLVLNTNTGGYCFSYDDKSRDFCFDLIENIVLKFILKVQINQVEIYTFDFNIKNSFPYLSQLKSEKIYHLSSRKSAKDDFDNLVEKARKIHHEILTPDTPTVSDYNEQSSFREKYHLLLINLEHFPDELVSFSEIKAFFESCFEAGFFILMYVDKNIVCSNNPAKYLYSKFPKIDINDSKVNITKELFPNFNLYDRYQFDVLPLEAQKRKDTFVNRFEIKVSNRPDFLNFEVGTSLDGREKRYFRLGDEAEAYHAFITGRSGTGKTTLINNIITSIAVNYTPNEIKLYLMDYKLGTEFGVYNNHPNCEKIYLDNENIQAAITMLEEFVFIGKEREVLFKQAKVSDIESYNKVNISHRIPHCILIIDEVHILFSGGFDYHEQSNFNALLATVAKQGRSFGMHLILTTQSLDGVNIEKSTMNQIPLRISYKLQDHMEAMKIFNENNTKEVLSLEKFAFIYNVKGGIKEANQYARAKFHSRDEIESIIDGVRQKNGYTNKPIVIDNANNDEYYQPDLNTINVSESEVSKKEELINSDFDTSAEKALLEKLKLWEQQNG